MMSVIIKGMEMPESCRVCRVACEHFLNLDGVMEKLFSSDSVRSDCPLIEVPSEDVVEVKHGKWEVLESLLRS